MTTIKEAFGPDWDVFVAKRGVTYSIGKITRDTDQMAAVLIYVHDTGGIAQWSRDVFGNPRLILDFEDCLGDNSQYSEEIPTEDLKKLEATFGSPRYAETDEEAGRAVLKLIKYWARSFATKELPAENIQAAYGL